MRKNRVGVLKKLRATAGFIGVVRNWGDHYLATHGRARPARMTYALRNGLELEARPRTLDVAVLKDVFFHRVYSPPGFEVRDNWTVLDVGAHIGAFSAQAARAASGVKVFAFEPAPDNFALLEANIARNRLTNVQPFQCAVAGTAGVRQLHLADSPVEYSLHLVKPFGTQLAVPSVTLAGIMEAHSLRRVDLLKLDCEGAEYEILEAFGSQGGLEKVSRIAMEAHVLDASRTPPLLAARLQAQGFRVETGFVGDATSMIWARRDQAKDGPPVRPNR